MYLCIYIAIHLHGISGQAAGSAGEIGGAPEDGDQMNLEIHLEVVMEVMLKMHLES